MNLLYWCRVDYHFQFSFYKIVDESQRRKNCVAGGKKERKKEKRALSFQRENYEDRCYIQRVYLDCKSKGRGTGNKNIQTRRRTGEKKGKAYQRGVIALIQGVNLHQTSNPDRESSLPASVKPQAEAPIDPRPLLFYYFFFLFSFFLLLRFVSFCFIFFFSYCCFNCLGIRLLFTLSSSIVRPSNQSN